MTIPLRIGQHNTHDRLVFDAPKGITYKLAHQGQLVRLSFSHPAQLALPQGALSRVQDFAYICPPPDGLLAVQFQVLPQAQVKSFFNGASIVVDISGAAGKTRMAFDHVKPCPPEPQAEEKIEEQEAELLPESLPEEELAPEQPLEPAPIEESPVVEEEPAEEEQAPVTTEEPIELQEPSLEPPFTPVESFHSTVKPFEQDSEAMKVFHELLNKPQPVALARFDPQIDVGAAIFARAGFITVLFDRKLTREVLSRAPPPLVKIERFDLPSQTGFRIPIPADVDVRVQRQGTAWLVYVVSTDAASEPSLDFIAQPDFAAGARVLLPTNNPPTPIFYEDPIVGDRLIILPLRQAAAFTQMRRFADFTVLAAAQGLVLRPLRDGLLVQSTVDGIELTAKDGLDLSPLADTGQKDQISSVKVPSLYDFSAWARAGASPVAVRQELTQAIVSASKENRLLPRLALARFYFARGLPTETLAVLDVMAQDAPQVLEDRDFLALRGAALIADGHFEAGLEDLNHITLRGAPETRLWRAIAQARLHDWGLAFESFKEGFARLAQYGEPYRTNFAVLGIETAAALGEDKLVGDWIAKVEELGYSKRAEPALRYLHGVITSKAGLARTAERLWQQVVHSDDWLYRVRAELALVDLGVATRSLTPAAAADRLEGMRFAWRGDGLEFDILQRLGAFYFDAGAYREGFSTLAQALRLYPHAPEAEAIKEKMSKIFRDLFATDLGADLGPLEALALYADFKTLMPPGQDGNVARRNLAERLISVDLLKQGEDLLEDVLSNTQDQLERAKIATRLAGVRLLNRRPQQALEALDKTRQDEQAAPESLLTQRRLLRARALSEKGDYAQALAVLPTQDNRDSLILRADMAMREHKWDDASQALLALVGAPPPSGTTLGEDKATWLINAAVALAQKGDSAGLDRLAVDFGPAMEKTSQGRLFHVLTRPSAGSLAHDLREAQGGLSEVDLFRSVLDGYRHGE
ncbi:MAG: hypothetical protein FWF24_03930 [Alphaproteobacteria bacterium]|nr:hypothetical protein [Alphaproteobacteria bacterium]